MPPAVSCAGPEAGQPSSAGRVARLFQVALGTTSADAPREQGDERQPEDDQRRNRSEGILDLGVGGTRGVPGEDDGDAPGDATRGVVEQELAVWHANRAGQCGHDGAEERHPPAEEDSGSAAAGEEIAGVVQPPTMAGQDVQLQDPRAEVTADLVADTVADDGCGDDGEQDAP